MGEIHAFRYDGGALVPCDYRAPRVGDLGGCMAWVREAGAMVLLYLPLDECSIGAPGREPHRSAILTALGRCNACAQPLAGHNDEDRAACAEVLREIAADGEASHGG